MSKRILSDTERQILELGLKFTPTPQRKNIEEIQVDLYDFCRKLRLSEYFLDKEYDDDSLVRNKSTFTPKPGRNKALDHYIERLTKFPLENSNSEKKKSNFSQQQWKCINDLKNDTSIIIKEADKGNAVIIMNSEFYKKLVLNIINDENYYRKCPSYSSQKVLKQLNDLISEYGAGLTDKEKDYIVNFECKESNFYGLPKVHKSRIISDACTNNTSSYIEVKEPNDLKLRPIVAGPCCETHRLSNFIDILLKPYISKVSSYIKDTSDFLNYLPNTTHEETILVSFDVTNLYSNITHELGIEAITYWINKHPELLPDRTPREFIIEGVRFILDNNFFNFNNTHYKQIKGTAMGTKVAPTYATLVLGFFEIMLYEKIEQEFGIQFRQYIKNNWKRFLDDCFILWTKNEENLAKFHAILNSINLDLSFTIEQNKEKIPFLDVLVELKEGKLSTDIFYKPTDTKQYLTYKSCHPKHTKNNIPYNLARRICSIVSENTNREKRLCELEIFLLQRGYPINVIKNGIEKAKTVPLHELRQEQNTTGSTQVIPYISTFNPKNPEIYSLIHNNISILSNDQRMKRVITENQFIKSKRQSKNLKKILTRAKFDETVSNDTPSVIKCGKSNCGTCPYLQEKDIFTFKNGMTFTIRSNITCSSKEVIYVITCNGCNENYIGQTTDLRKRVTVHRQQIRHTKYTMIPLSEHIRTCAKYKNPIFFICPIYRFLKDSTENERIIKEKRFINIFKPKLNAI